MGWKSRLILGAINKARVSPTSTPPRYVKISGNNNDRRTRKGYVPVVVGKEDGVGERFLIPAQFMGHPSIVVLLELSTNVFGYGQEGVIRIPCDPDCFKEIISHLPFKTS